MFTIYSLSSLIVDLASCISLSLITIKSLPTTRLQNFLLNFLQRLCVLVKYSLVYSQYFLHI